VYLLSRQQGQHVTVNAESDEALSRIVGEAPMFFYMNREVYPLTTRENHEQRIRNLLQQQQ
jgi:muconolactone delta-isomerase